MVQKPLPVSVRQPVGRGDMKQITCIMVVVFCITTWLGTGCSRESPQFEAEGQTINEIFRLLPIYVAEHPDIRIVSAEQLLTNHTGIVGDYPHQWHRRFQRYGRHAGFTNSVYEKYVFFAPGIRNSKIEGELFLMNAAPYPGSTGEMQRKVVSKTSDSFHCQTFSEQTVQLMLKESGIAEPKPIRMPTPPPAPPEAAPMPFSTKVSRFFMRVADYAGISGHWLLLRNITIGAGMVALALLGAYLWFSRTRRR